MSVLVAAVAFLGFARFALRQDAALDYARWCALLFASLLVFFVFARLGFYAVNWQHYANEPVALLQIWRGGVVYTSGALAVVVAFFPLTRFARLPRWPVLDVIALCTALYSGLEPLVDIAVLDFPIGHRLYSGVAQLVIFAALLGYHSRRRFAGEVFLLWVMASSLTSAIVSTLRVDRAFVVGTDIDARQIVCALVIVACAIVWARKRARAL